MKKTVCKLVIFLLLIVGASGCAEINTVPVDINKIVYPNKYMADPPNEHWQRMENCRELKLYAPELVNIYFKKDTGSIILLRAGRKSEYGVPIEYELTKAEMIYLLKFVPHGSFEKAEEYKFENPLWEKAEKLFKYKVDYKEYGTGRMLAAITQRGEVLLAEFFSPQTAPAEDEADFYKFLNSLQERKTE